MSQSQDFDTDVVIIGAGPVGLFAIFECGMLDMRVAVIDALDFIGGQCQALYPEKPIYDIPAYPKIMAGQLVEKLKAQAEPFKPTYHLGHQVTGCKEIDGGFHLTSDKGLEIKAKAVIIAAGAGAFGPNRPPLENIEEFEGVSVHYMVGARHDFQDKTVVIAGGGDSAVDWALSLSEIAKKVYLVHRRDRFRAMPESVTKMKQIASETPEKMELVIPYMLDSLHGSKGQLNSVTVKTLEGETRKIEADTLLPFFGLKTSLGPIAEWGLNVDRTRIEVEASTCETNTSGIFAIGDVALYPGKKKLILQGFSDAAMAAYGAYPLIHPDKPLNYEHSTDKGLPTAKI